jgi:RimJ/RimL family protein N-acetyltransferase
MVVKKRAGPAGGKSQSVRSAPGDENRLGGKPSRNKMESESALETTHLRLRLCLPAQILALIEDPGRFESETGFPAGAGLREMFASGDVSSSWVETLRLAQEPDPWRFGFFVVHQQTGAAIGMAGFKGPPDASGTVEIAYGIAPSFEGRGYATEAAAALVLFAFRRAEASLISAHTLPETNGSTRVLTKCGFRHVGTVVDPEDGTVWRWELSR